jgi:hypothetical protein
MSFVAETFPLVSLRQGVSSSSFREVSIEHHRRGHTVRRQVRLVNFAAE